MKILNLERYEDTKVLLDESQYDFSDADIVLYANAFEIISKLTGNKLSNKEIFYLYDLIGDVMVNLRPDIIEHVDQDDRIRVAVKLLEKLPETKDKLTTEEKLAFAFCVKFGELTQVYDKKENTIKNGIAFFDTYEHIKKEFEYERAELPSLYEINDFKMNKLIIKIIDNDDVILDDNYGLSVETPVLMTSVFESYKYLNGLYYNNRPIKYKRICSMSDSKNGIIDKYEIFYEKKRFLKSKIVYITDIYINAYSLKAFYVPPKGFTIKQ